MGQLTRDTIISEALLLAGNTSLTTRAKVWLNAWLRSQYRAHAWPFLIERASLIAMAADSLYVTVGANNGGITLEIQRIIDPIDVYTSDYATRMRARVVQLIGQDQSEMVELNNPATNRGVPSAFRVRATTTWGAWKLVPNVVPDRACKLAFDYLYQPADLSTNVAPVYPNDETLIQAVYVQALKHMDKLDAWAQQFELLRTQQIADRAKYGIVDGTNDLWSLDSSIFR